jgi:hypothetical protein
MSEESTTPDPVELLGRAFLEVDEARAAAERLARERG